MYVRIAEDKLKKLCAERGMTLSGLLAQSGVSRNAFYTLARKENILPRSIASIANTLNLSAFDFLESAPSPAERAQQLYDEVDRISELHKDVDPDNVRHTLQLLEENPVDRLRRALTRAQRFNFH